MLTPGRLLVLLVTAGTVQAPAPLPQIRSPLTETTRPHPRVSPYVPEGERAAVLDGTLFLRKGLKHTGRLPLVIHFHGEPWIVEHEVAALHAGVALVSFQLGSGSDVYGRAFADPDRFNAVVDEARGEVSRIFGRPVTFAPVILTSFSAGYGAVRAILRQPDAYARVSSVVLADSLHADYVGDVAGPRTTDPGVAAGDIDVFLRLAADAAAGRKRFLVTHSEVYPGTYASTTDTADALLSSLGLRRRPRLHDGPIGMQQLSDTARGGFRVIGYAGNSASDHLDHLYALGTRLPAALP